MPPTTDKKINGNGAKWHQWPGIFRAARMVPLSVPNFRQLVDAGDIPFEVDDQGQPRFDPDKLVRLAPQFRELSAADFDAGEQEAKRAATAADEQATRSGVPVEGIRAQAQFIGQIMKQNEELHQRLLSMSQALQTGYQAASAVQDQTISRLHEQVQSYQRQWDALMAAKEQALSVQAERDLALAEQKEVSERRGKVVDIVRVQAERLVQIVAAKYGVNLAGIAGWDTERLAAAVELFNSLQGEQLDVAKQFDFFDARQKELIELITKGRKAQQQPESESESCDNRPAENTAQTPPLPG